MRFLHTADWHIGKKLQGYDLLEEQAYALQAIFEIAKKEQVDAIIIAGDLYDRSVPATEAIDLFNQTIINWNLINDMPILAISGNHDSAARLATGGQWFKQTNFHLHTELQQAFKPVEIGNTQIFLLPYFEPISARLYFEDDSIRTIQDAIPRVIDEMKNQFDATKQQVLVSHFFVLGSERSDSETKIEVGGLDAISGELLHDFDYAALGHLHNQSALQQSNARYSGSPLKFSLSEINQKKGVWLVDVSGDLTLDFQIIKPIHDMIELTGSFSELIQPENYNKINREDFAQIYLTDRAIIPNMMHQLRKIYPRILGVERINGREHKQVLLKKISQIKDPETLAQAFFKEMTQEELTDEQKKWLTHTLSEIKETE